MNIDPDDPSERQLDALLAVARAAKPDTSRSEYGFETRLMSNLATRKSRPSLWWGTWTWRLAPLFAVVALGLSLWTQFAPIPNAVGRGTRTALESAGTAEDDLGGLVLDDFLTSS